MNQEDNAAKAREEIDHLHTWLGNMREEQQPVTQEVTLAVAKILARIVIMEDDLKTALEALRRTYLMRKSQKRYFISHGTEDLKESKIREESVDKWLARLADRAKGQKQEELFDGK